MPEGETNLRRPPKQERSRERVDEILGATKRLIGEKGIDAVTMRDIATMTGSPISSIYQYFPNKSAILATLHGRLSDEVLEMIGAVIEDASGIDDLLAAAATIFDLYYQRTLADPAMIDLLNAVQADKALNNADIISTRKQAEVFSDAARPWIRQEQFELFSRISFMVFQLAGGAVRLAHGVEEEEARGIVADYQMIIRTQLTHFVEKSKTVEFA
jgi:AcrR family transcriptional regulator